MNKQVDEKRKDRVVGIFMSAGLMLLVVSIIILGGSENLFSSKKVYKSHLSNAAGVMIGSKVMFSGVPAGAVTRVKYDAVAKDIEVEMEINDDYASFLREGSSLEVLTQGVLGDKYLAIDPGSGDALIPAGGYIANKQSKDFFGVLSKGDEFIGNMNVVSVKLARLLDAFDKGNKIQNIMVSLEKTSRNADKMSQEISEMKLKAISQELHGILEKLNRGTGSLGALINDPSLYEDARALVGGANRNRILRNVVRSTTNDGGDQNSKK